MTKELYATAEIGDAIDRYTPEKEWAGYLSDG
jgi:hypothetical protein